MYAGVTQAQIQQIKALVDRGGWNAVRQHPELSRVWAKSVQESRKWVNVNIRN